jgi:16S rRNA (cytosine967-C5)-methyltransferase
LSRRTAPAGAAVRAAAADLVARVVEERIAVDDWLPAAAVAERDRALLAALVLGALRWHHRLDWQVGRLLARPLKRGQERLAALLRIGLLQLQEFRIPAHAAVSATVDAAALVGASGAAPLVNAVLRRFQREADALARAAQDEPLARFSHPAWLIEVFRSDYPADWQALLDADNAPPPMWLRVNLARTTRSAYLDTLRAAGLAGAPSGDVASAVRLEQPVGVDSLPGFAAGDVSVQDVAAQRAVGYLDLAPGQRILDACAAPGGKTGHILEAIGGRAEVFAVDRDPGRLGLVAENLSRLGLSATLVVGDAAQPGTWWDGQPFDRILLDAPCSATGVIRRHPDIKVRRRPEDVERVVPLQAAMLMALWPLLKPGGRLVYATCTVLKRENAEQIAAFRAGQSGIGDAGERQFLTGEAEGDGFYYAWLPSSHPMPMPSARAP